MSDENTNQDNKGTTETVETKGTEGTVEAPITPVIPVETPVVVESPVTPVVVETPVTPVETPVVVEAPVTPVVVETPVTPVVITPTDELLALDLDTNPPDYPTMKKLVKELGIETVGQKANILLDALVAKKAELTSPTPFDSAQGPISGGSNTVENTELRAKMQPYFDYNPHVDLFYVTSDGMPFYDKQDAIRQQKSVDPEIEILIINR